MEIKLGIETVLGVVTGIGLSAACGFRIFVPLLVMNLAVLYGRLHLAPGFEWIGSHYATIAFGTATGLEILAYYIPWLDNVLDAITSPVSIIAGTIATASVITDMPPSMKWMVAIIAGGGIAGIIQGVTTGLRGKSSLLTGGFGNPFVSTLELAGAVLIALLAIIIPVICLILVAAFTMFVIFRALRNHFQKMSVR
ncbi:MAG: hypothetical protein A4E65_02739 [Syntrophorhabdus sp. PtaU1.Bin153]|nr:MAG: hypothetical protein A4E65_02739 [Syntrophorhabdus sp. PtaU1.Bin153]